MGYQPDDASLDAAAESRDKTAGESVTSQSIILSLSEIFYPVYKRIFNEREEFSSRQEQRLTEANISTPVEVYLSSVIAVGTILGGIFGIGCGAILYFLLGTQITLPVTPYEVIPFSDAAWMQVVIQIGSYAKIVISVLLASLIGAVIGVGIAFAVAIGYPRAEIYQRQREIDLVMPDLIAFMYSLSVGGMDQLDIMRAVAESEDTYGEAAVEFQRIVKQMEYFNIDYQTAVQNVAQTTPSDDLSRFLTDMMSIINSGGDVSGFLETQKDFYMNEVKRKQEKDLDTLETFGEFYMSLSVFPMILLIVLVIMSLLGQPQAGVLAATVYGVIPLLNGLYGVLISIIKTESVGSGRLKPDGDEAIADAAAAKSITNLTVIDKYRRKTGLPVFEDIRSQEIRHRLSQFFRNPLEYFLERPLTTLWITIPVSLCAVVLLTVIGWGTPSLAALEKNTFRQTLVYLYVPLFLTVTPISVLYEWSDWSRGSITRTLTDDLRKLASTNETGKTLVESFQITGEGNPSRLGAEFRTLHKKVGFGQSLKPALIEMNNRYQVPRLARTVKLVEKAQESSNQITKVLRTAAELSENQDSLEKERKTRTQMQVVIIAVTFLVFLAVMVILKAYFVDRMSDIIGSDPSWAQLDSLNPSFLTMIFFHAVVVQAICSGFISGYIQSGKKRHSLKYVLLYTAIAAVSWWLIIL